MKIKFLVLFSLYFLAGCSSSYFTIEPKDEFEIFEGRKIITKVSEGIEYSLNIEDLSPSEADFLLVIENASNDTIRISPADASLEILTSRDDNYSGKKISPLMPDKILSVIEKERIEIENDYAANKSLTCILGSINILASLLDENPGTDPIYEGGRLLGDIENIENDYETRKDYLNAIEDFWRNDALKTEIVPPGGDAGGIVVFPFNQEIREFKIFVKTRNDVLEFHFEQKEISE